MMIRLSPVVLCQEDIRTFFGSSDLIESSSGDSRRSEPPPPPDHEVGAPSAVFLAASKRHSTGPSSRGDRVLFKFSGRGVL